MRFPFQNSFPLAMLNGGTSVSIIFHYASARRRNDCIPAKGSKAALIVWHWAIAHPLKSWGGDFWDLLQPQLHLLKPQLTSYNLGFANTESTTQRSCWAPISSQHQLNSSCNSVQGCWPRFESSFSLTMAVPYLMQHLPLKFWSKQPTFCRASLVVSTPGV